MLYNVSKSKGNKPKQERLTIYDIKRRTSEKQPYFFSHDTMKFFGQNLNSFSVYKRKDGKYDVVAPSYQNGKLMGYTRRVFDPKTNDLEFPEGK